MEFDKYEKEILDAYENNALVQSEDIEKEIKIAKQASKSYFTKDARINIRLSSVDLNILKRQAAKEGLAYQSYISSLLHKIASGGL
jgi:predicted DNA binding CopG/RHH family protein